MSTCPHFGLWPLLFLVRHAVKSKLGVGDLWLSSHFWLSKNSFPLPISYPMGGSLYCGTIVLHSSGDQSRILLPWMLPAQHNCFKYRIQYFHLHFQLLFSLCQNLQKYWHFFISSYWWDSSEQSEHFTILLFYCPLLLSISLTCILDVMLFFFSNNV